MKNLAGETKADLDILTELTNAGIEVVECGRSRREVPYTLTGRLADWKFSRAWFYWMANAENGLPLNVAKELHKREYSVKGDREPETFGQVIRVDGDCGCPAPTGSVMSYHVDSQEGLNALAGAIGTFHKMGSSGTDAVEVLRLYNKISALYTEWQTEQKQEDVEWLTKMPTILYSNGRIVDELIVAIRNEQEVVSIVKKWKDKQGYKGIVQYFFKDGQITGFNSGRISGPGQILNRGPEVDEMLRPHYDEVKAIRPKAADSLKLCMRELEKPGPKYNGDF